MKKDPLIFVEHILQNIGLIEDFSKGLSKAELISSELKQYALVRALEIIGEAVKNIPLPIKAKYGDIPWKKIAGFRDVVIHQYFGVDLDLVWVIVKKEIPTFKKQVQKVKEGLVSKK